MDKLINIKNNISKKQRRLEVISILFDYDCYEDKKMPLSQFQSLTDEENMLIEWLKQTALDYPELATLCT